ncbi:MAG: condensation domain-containing protein, partial [Halobacteriales archaeon]|nr:condensation domain-containing protein [Halobacteriales archaeon]
MREEAALAPLAPPAQEAGAAGADAFPLSFAQQRLWFIHQWAPASAAYNLPVVLQLTGALDAAALEGSLAEIVRRHATLRTTYAVSGGEPVQLVAPFRGFTLPAEEVAGPTPEARLRSALQLAEAEGRRPFDLRAGPVLRARLLRCDPQEHLLLLTFHHIAFDGWSGGVFFRELMALYQAFREGRPSPLEPLPIQYSDFALWQRTSVQGDELGRQLDQLAKRLQGVAPLELPTDRTRPAQQTFRGGESHFSLPIPLSDSLQALARAEDATLFMVLLAGFQALLHRATGQEDFAVGSPIAGRSRPELEGLVGFFVNTLVLRADAGGDPTFRDFLARVRATCVDAYAHQDVPFERIVEALKPERDPSRNPLVQVVFALQNIPPVKFRMGGLTLKELEAPTATTPFDLALFMSKGQDTIQGTVQYCTDLF